MTWTVYLGTGSDKTEITGIIWTSESRWKSSPDYKNHTIPGALHSKLWPLGRDSPMATMGFRCRKNAANMAVIHSMEGAELTVVSGVEGTHKCYCSGISDSKTNSAWYFCSMSLIDISEDDGTNTRTVVWMQAGAIIRTDTVIAGNSVTAPIWAAGWAASDGGTTVFVASGATFTLAASTTLYAIGS